MKHVSISTRKMWGIQIVRSLSLGGSKWLLSIGLGERVITYSFGRNPEIPTTSQDTKEQV